MAVEVEGGPNDYAVSDGYPGSDLSIAELCRAVALKTRLAEKTGCVLIYDISRRVTTFSHESLQKSATGFISQCHTAEESECPT